MLSANVFPWDQWSLLTLALVIGSVAAGLGALIWVRRQSKEETPVEDPDELLSEFRSLHKRGEMTSAEFERIRGVLGNKIRTKAGMPPVQAKKLPPLEDPTAATAETDEYEWHELDLETIDPDDATKPTEPE